jgi:cytochrome c
MLNSKKSTGLLLLLLFVLGQKYTFSQEKSPLKGKKILVFSKTTGYRHKSIEPGIKFFKNLGNSEGFAVDTTENSTKFTDQYLKQYKVVVFMCTTGDILNEAQQIAFERYIQAGGGFLGVHAAADTEYDWPWYGRLVGGYFNGHPGKNVSNIQKGMMYTLDKNHPSTDFLPDNFEKTDEFYSFKNFSPAVKTLIRVDEKSYQEGTMGDFHPMAWYQEYDGGRSFYSNFGHTDETFTSEPLMMKHFAGGLNWAAAGPEIDYSKIVSAPEENRFSKIILDEKLDEPTEMAVMNDGRVIFAERKGKVKLYDPKLNKSKTINQLDVYTKFEYGLMGLNIDPNFDKNHWVYMYYSPIKGDTSNTLSRYVFDEGKQMIDLDSEKMLLKVPVKRTDCCHTGGSIEWDKQGNLYLSTGDDVNPFDSDGYGPMDNRPNRQGWDARASSSNTNDLRGKILRIKPLDNGTYEIPEGNLFPKGTDKTKPEIYVMGCRNPYRISVDKRTGFLYWGEVGPDAGENSEKYGPRGHDEMNQARKAGYFGWPLFVADNRAYKHRDFNDSTTTYAFDPAKPFNDSPHNTGLNYLPPANKAFIYYPYADSPEFGPVVGKGGRNAMGGPVYYFDDYADSPVKFPKYYNGKFFSYDWIRDWINPVTMNANGDFLKMERFMPNMKISHPMDMAFGKDGAMYLLEYGPNWFAQNDEAMLSRIEYNAGNRKPFVKVVANKKAGAVPLKVAFNTNGTKDYDGDAIAYNWKFGNGTSSKLANPTATYNKAGIYNAILTVTDKFGNSSSETINISVGNDVPKVDLVVKGNKSFYWDDQKIDYEVKVSDKEDGSLTNKKINPEEVYVNIDFLEGFDKTMIAQGHQMNTGFSNGKRLIELSDCKSCHAVEKKSIGPAYLEVAKKYKAGQTNIAKLSEKIIKGGGGVWGEQAMAAHPQVSIDDAREMVKYILSLNDPKKASQPVKGDYLTQKKSKDGSYLLTATYTDKGANKIAPQTAGSTVALRNAKLKANTYDEAKSTMNYKSEPLGEIVIATENGGFISFKKIDLTNISALQIGAFATDARLAGGKIELRIGSKIGSKIGEVEIKQGSQFGNKLMTISPQKGEHDLYFVFVNPESSNKPLLSIADISFEKAK